MQRRQFNHMLAGLPALGLPQVGSAQGLAPEVQVSTADITDIEFDSGRDGVYCPGCNGGFGNARFAHVTTDNELWVAGVDPVSGDFLQPDGRGMRVDHNVSGLATIGNGPEWMFSRRGSELVYTRYADGTVDAPENRSLGLARLKQGAWLAGPVAGTQYRQNPGGSLDRNDTVPRVVYTNVTRSALYWREVGGQGGGGEQPIPLSYPQGSVVTRRWVAGTRDLILTAPAPPDASGVVYNQVFRVLTATGEVRQFTFDPVNKYGAFSWRAPEFGNNWVFFTVAERRQVLIYRVLPGSGGTTWRVINTITPPASTPFIGSPEYLLYNGRSYIYFWVSNSPDDSLAPSQIAITGIDPALPSLRLLTADAAGEEHSRRDPEHYITAAGPRIYYVRVRLPASLPLAYQGMHRVDAGLGPSLA